MRMTSFPKQTNAFFPKPDYKTSLFLFCFILICFLPFQTVQAGQSPIGSFEEIITYTISGNAGVGGAALSYNDGAGKTAIAGSDGVYSFVVPANWSGTVTPSLVGYTFAPTSLPYSSVAADQPNQNYTATLVTYTISGNAGVAGATLSYTDGGAKTATAGSDGAYSFVVPANWSGTVTPSLAGYSFAPTSLPYSSVAADQPNQNYTATLLTYIISGNTGVAGTTLTYTVNAVQTTSIADGLGEYSITVPYNWSGTVKPASLGYTFSPTTKSYTNVRSNQTAQNFTPNTSNKTYYVDKTKPACSDGGAGTSQSAPFCTISAAAAKAIGGDTIRVLAGSYAETVKPNPGIAGYPVTISALPDTEVTGSAGNNVNGGAFRMAIASYITIDGFAITGTSDYGIYIFGSNHITLSNNDITLSGATTVGNTRYGIFLDHTTDSLITANTLYKNSDDGIRLMYSTNNTISNNISYSNSTRGDRDATGINLYYSSSNIILHNTVYANDDSGINIYAGSNSNQIVGNVTYGNGDHGIDNNASQNNIIVGNTVQGNVTAGINLEGDPTGSGGATLMNNVMVDNGLLRQVGGGTSPGSPGNLRIDANSKTGTTLNYNLYYLSTGTVQIIFEPTRYNSLSSFKSANPGLETNGLQSNPLLLNPATPAVRPSVSPFTVAENPGEYQIMAGSPAIDSAISSALNEPAFDIAGFARVDDLSVANSGTGTRDYDDRGAYEFQPPCYGLTINPGVGGATPTATPTKSPSCANSGEFIANQVIQLTGASPSTGFQITGWEGTNSDSSTLATNSVTMPASARTAGVIYSPILSVSKNGTGTGIVTSDPDGINCGLNCSHSFGINSSIELTATAAVGSTFNGWSAAGTGTGIRNVVMDGAKSVTATFNLIEYTLEITSLHGTVAKNPNKAIYHYGDVVQLSITADPGWNFASWSGNAAGTSSPVSVTINGNKTVTANYTQKEYTLSVTSSLGDVSKNPDQSSYHYGDVVQLTATADTGWKFANWSGDASGTNNPSSIIITGNMAITANYALGEYSLTILNTDETVTRNPDKPTYHYGDVVELTATANPGWIFSNWSDDASSSANPFSITITGDMTVSAIFVQEEFTLTVTSLHGNVTFEPDTATYHYGDVVRITAVPNKSWAFANWEGDATGSSPSTAITITGNMSITANYIQYLLYFPHTIN